MDRRITLGVLVVLAVLGGYIWYAFLRADAPPQTPATPEPTAISFLTLAPDTVQAVEVRDVKNDKVTRIVRAGDKWNMEQPAQGEADASRVDALLFGVTNLDAARKLEVSGDLAQFGLNPALFEVKLTLTDGTSQTIAVGGKNPDGNSYYVSKGGDAAVYLISSTTGGTIEEFVSSPPYTPTPTETLAPTETPEPSGTPEGGGTPEATVTP